MSIFISIQDENFHEMIDYDKIKAVFEVRDFQHPPNEFMKAYRRSFFRSMLFCFSVPDIIETVRIWALNVPINEDKHFNIVQS